MPFLRRLIDDEAFPRGRNIHPFLEKRTTSSTTAGGAGEQRRLLAAAVLDTREAQGQPRATAPRPTAPRRQRLASVSAAHAGAPRSPRRWLLAKYYLRLGDREVEAELEETPKAACASTSMDEWQTVALQRLGDSPRYALTRGNKTLRRRRRQRPR